MKGYLTRVSRLLPTQSPYLLPPIVRPDDGEPIQGAEPSHRVPRSHVQREAEEVQSDIANTLTYLGNLLIRVKDQVVMMPLPLQHVYRGIHRPQDLGTRYSEKRC